MGGIDPIIPVRLGDEGRVHAADPVPRVADHRERDADRDRRRRERAARQQPAEEDAVTLGDDGRPHIDLSV